MVTRIREAGRLDRVLVSHDAGWYQVGTPGGGDFRGYDLVFTGFIPALKTNGFSDGDIATIFVTNPARAFGLRKRPI